MSSENTGDVIVDNSSVTAVGPRSPELGLVTQAATWRDRRALSRDRLRSPVHLQLKPADIAARNCLLAEPLIAPNRRLSKVLPHAPSKTDAQLVLMRRSM